MRGLVTLVAGHAVADGDVGAATLARVIGRGSELRTDDGQLAVQFGEGSALALGPHSHARIARFDDGAIELEVEGQLDVEVSARRPGQRFVVRAAGREVEVRGTQFRVDARDGKLDVRCAHGAVAVRGGTVDGPERLVRAAEGVTLSPGTVDQVRALTTDEVATLAAAVPYQLPAWSPIDALHELSAPLTVAGVDGQVRVDGVARTVGAGEVVLRVLPGRHLVEHASAAHGWREVGWAEVGAGRGAHLAVAPAEVEAPTSPGAGVAARRRVLAAHGAELAACVRPLEKQGVFDTHATVDLVVDASGRVQAVSVVETDLPASAAACVRDAIAGVRFGAGPAVRFRQRLTP
ncbi:MAG: FecR domain-containing protein [Kofleriaceae bacterium]